MKVYVEGKQVILVGKAWEIRQKLKEYGAHFQYVHEWVSSISSESKKVINS
ncbi:Z-ring formation inhibitor MciZ [Priestia flexa]|uniref:Z-ring formation inhibitor MciZ n=1 Tax=Priestia flexa TaxID=86664 RepID=UPI001B331E01|nr:Z-ring formation inhibitor MciZ [Priestia flexa]